MRKREDKMRENKKRIKPLYYYPHSFVSFTALNSFLNCPYGFYVRNYLKIKLDPNDKMMFGINFQNLLNAKYLKQDTEKELDTIVKEKRALADKLVKGAFDFDKIISADKPYDFDLGYGIPLRFVPDLLTEDSIVENKTTTGFYNRRSVNKEMQMDFYYVGVRRTFGFIPKCYYQIFNVKTEKVDLIEVQKDNRNVDNFVNWVGESLIKIKKCYDRGIWDIGYHKLCNYPRTCPLNIDK